MREESSDSRTYELQWHFVPRIATEHLGSLKYSSTTKAIRELVANALDAEATIVKIEFKENKLGGIESIVISDNGRGISPVELQERFVFVGVEPNEARSAVSLGRFGVGRLAVHRVGSLSEWTTVSQLDHATRVRISFTLTSESRKNLSVREELVSASTPLGTTIEIFNILDRDNERLTPTIIANDLLAHYCSYLLGNPSRKIFVQDELVDVEEMIERRETESLPRLPLVPQEARLDHLLLSKPVDRSRFPAHVLFAAKGRTVATAIAEDTPGSNYLGIIECPYLDSMVTSNRELLIEMDGGFAQLKEIALERISRFGERLRSERTRAFIEQARQEAYYPYRDAPTDAVTTVQQAVYDVVLDKLNETTNVEGMTKRQQQVVFQLLKRSLDNENVLEVLHEVAKLSDEDMEKFRRVLERTTLDSIIKLSSEVTSRLEFLDILHQLVYGQPAKHLKERSQLHRILEPHCWIFGPQFHLATSDQSFREIIRRHRKQAGLEDIGNDVVQGIKGIEDIPDLFLVVSRDFPVEPKHHHVLVELKAPSVSLGRTQVEQIRRYADTILDSPQFDKTSTRWDLFLISTKATGEIDRDRRQKNQPHGCLWLWDNMTVWAFSWSEIITKAKEEMQLVREHLRKKSEELTVSDYLRQNFPEVLDSLADKL
jgi:hypothetical protein